MLKFKHFFLSRKTILSLISLILSAVVVAYIFPQRFSIPASKIEKWQQANPFWNIWVDRLGLDHVYSTPWFAALLFAFLLSLTISAYEQIRSAVKKTFSRGALPGGKNLRLSVPEEELITALTRQGYLKIAGNEGGIRFVKHPWGYWGNVLLHLGIVVAIASSLLIVLTEKRGLLHLVEEELSLPGSPWLVEEKGILAGEFILPEAVRLESVIPEFWETDDIRQLTTVLSFIDPVGRFKQNILAINQTINYRGLRMYQSQSFGHAFFVELTDKEGMKNRTILQIQSPSRRDRASYGNFNAEGIPYRLKAKYFADAEKKSMISTNPLLILRLVVGDKVIGEASLKMGESGRIGPYTARLVNVSKWAGIILVDITGMPGIFLGFFIIILGGGLTYFFPPREFYVKKETDGFSLSWRASRFEDFYKEEFERITAEFGGEKTS